MIFIQSKVKIVDTTNVNNVKCISIVGKNPKSPAKTGEVFLGVVKNLKKSEKKTFKKGVMGKVLLIITKKNVENYKKSGIFIKSITNNFGVIVSTEKVGYNILSKKILCPVLFKTAVKFNKINNHSYAIL